MPAKDKVNLLPKVDFEESTPGKLLNWIVGVGRWIVVFTEFVVICAFLSRFYFDTKLSNLFDSLRQKKAMVDSALTFQEEFLRTQEKIKIIKSIFAEEQKPSLLITQISQLLPLDTILTSVQINQQSVRLSGYSMSERGIDILAKQITQNPRFSQINLGSLTKKEFYPGIYFEINAKIKND